MHNIFISYSRRDKDVVFRLKDEIERVTGRGSCWIDLAGIESDKEFVDVIIEAIDQAETFLFMYSRHSDASEWTRKEVEYAQSEMKRIVFVRIDSEPLSKYYRFQFSGHDIIDLQDKDEKRKLLLNPKEWAGCSCEAGSPAEEPVKTAPTGRLTAFVRSINPFSGLLHPIVNMGIAFQLFLLTLLLLMAGWTFMVGCLAFYHHPQVSHMMLILALGTSLTATCKIGSLRSYWLALIFALDFIEAYLVSHLAEYLYLNWPQMAEIPYPSSIRYQLLYDLGASMQLHKLAGTHTTLLVLVLAHIIAICLALCIRRDGRSAWSMMK